MPPVYAPPALDEIEAARERITATVLRTPLVRLQDEQAPAEVYLKLENLQPMGSFKVRGAGNALGLVDDDRVTDGLWTASAGNMAQAVAWHARERGVSCRVVVPETAPQTKLDSVVRLGAELVKVSPDTWFEVFRSREHPGMEGLFLHAFSDAAVIAANGTIGLEIAEDLPDVDAVIVPYGGGGLVSGIASALSAVAPRCQVFACEVETAAPFATALAVGEPVEVEARSSFVDGMGGPRVFPEMFELVRQLVAGSIVVSVDAIAAAVRLLAERNRVIAEGAGAAPVAAALTGRAGTGKVVCVISGGNIDSAVLRSILAGKTP
jgi:threonine dehydratase